LNGNDKHLKVLLTIWGVFTPYNVWMFYCIGSKKLPPNPWPAIILLSYLFVGRVPHASFLEACGF
jgi:hypothetical protein